MPAQNHPAYAEELERCKYTLEYVEKSLDSTSAKKQRIDSELEKVRKHFNSENSQDYIDIIINSTLKGSIDLKLRNLLTARSRPYFARIDFAEGSDNKTEKLYIGKMSLVRDEDQQIIIVDWRAPVANLYYEGRLGDSAYACPDGMVEGQLKLKRQFSINSGNLQEIFDIDITTNDEFLQAYLGANADNRLKEIVSTIQTEQNAIVRADMWKPLIVQGAAGSGKTTIALHRIAYLIYTYEKTFAPENFMIIAPNRLFLNYISDVLPELGVEKVKQTTFEDFAQELIGKKFKIRDANEKLVAFANPQPGPEEAERNRLVRLCSEFKTSMLIRDIMDDYIKSVEVNFIPHEDFRIGNRIIYKYEELNRLFINEYKMWPIARRVNEIKKNLSTRLKQQKNALINQLHDDSDMLIMNLKTTMAESDERQSLIIKAIDERNDKIEKIEGLTKKAVSDYIGKISKLSPFEYYCDLMYNKDIFTKVIGNRIDQELADFVQDYTSKLIKSGFIEIEDLAPIIYLKFCIYGMDEKIPVKHIIIDEAQDFSAFQIYVLKRIVKDSSFTILGDLNQGIHSYRGIRDWNDITENVFSDRRNEFLILEQSYRTTIEIMDAANKVLENIRSREILKAKPVIRHGEEVRIIRKDTLSAIAGDIKEKIMHLKEESLKSMAVICKTMDECKKIHGLLSKDVKDIFIITGKEEEYKSGIAIVPSYLAKGLEFDAVFISDAGSTRYGSDELDIKLLYVAMTRPLHKLYIYHIDELSPLLNKV
jgi:Superfamily I DNA and RNA helicases